MATHSNSTKSLQERADELLAEARTQPGVREAMDVYGHASQHGGLDRYVTNTHISYFASGGNR